MSVMHTETYQMLPSSDKNRFRVRKHRLKNAGMSEEEAEEKAFALVCNNVEELEVRREVTKDSPTTTWYDVISVATKVLVSITCTLLLVYSTSEAMGGGWLALGYSTLLEVGIVMLVVLPSCKWVKPFKYGLSFAGVIVSALLLHKGVDEASAAKAIEASSVSSYIELRDSASETLSQLPGNYATKREELRKEIGGYNILIENATKEAKVSHATSLGWVETVLRLFILGLNIFVVHTLIRDLERRFRFSPAV